MRELLVFAFQTTDGARQARDKVAELQKQRAFAYLLCNRFGHADLPEAVHSWYNIQIFGTQL